jgi:hypothetical protein
MSEYELAEAMNQLSGTLVETQASVERTAQFNLEAARIMDRLVPQVARLTAHLDAGRDRDQPPSTNGSH